MRDFCLAGLSFEEDYHKLKLVGKCKELKKAGLVSLPGTVGTDTIQATVEHLQIAAVPSCLLRGLD